jgi:hypothetical protein
VLTKEMSPTKKTQEVMRHLAQAEADICQTIQEAK